MLCLRAINLVSSKSPKKNKLSKNDRQRAGFDDAISSFILFNELFNV